MKKSFAFGMLLAAGMLVACGAPNTPSTSAATSANTSATSANTNTSAAPVSEPSQPESVPSATSEAEPEVTQTYEILGSYDELYSQFAAFEFYGALYSDGTGVLYEATVSAKGENANVPTVDEGVTFKYRIEEDEEAKSLTASISGKKYNGFQGPNGNFTLEYSFTFAGAYSRTVNLTISPTIKYADNNAWAKAVAEEYGSRTVEVTTVSTFAGPVFLKGTETQYQATLQGNPYNCTAEVLLKSDLSVAASWGVAFSGAFYGGQKDLAGRWTLDTTKKEYTITIGESSFTAVTAEGVTTASWEFTFTPEEGEPVELEAKLTLAVAA